MQKVIPNGPCIYFLLKDKMVIYIGQTDNLKRRLQYHHIKVYDTYRAIECKIDRLNFYEKRWILVFKPPLNRLTQGSYTRFKSEKRDIRVELRFPVKQYELIQEKASKKNITVSEYLRILSLNDCKK